MSVKYDACYEEDPAACGEPFPQILEELRELPAPARILDLGCGQGRDALPAARLGHRVLAVDLSSVGLSQLEAVAAAEGLDIDCVQHDIVDFEPDGDFDVVLLDRVLHMLPDDAQRTTVLQRSTSVTRPGGTILLADTPSSWPLIEGFFRELDPAWSVTKLKKGMLRAYRPLSGEPDRTG